jgi:hypothetical protein
MSPTNRRNSIEYSNPKLFRTIESALYSLNQTRGSIIEIEKNCPPDEEALLIIKDLRKSLRNIELLLLTLASADDKVLAH